MTPNRSLKRKLLAAAIAAALSPAAQAVDYVWLSGNYDATVGPNPLPAGDRLLGQGLANKNFFGINFTNQGSVVWQTTSRIGFVSSTVTNSALWDMQADANLSYTGGSGSNFINGGTFRKSAGAGSTVIGSANIAFVNSGTVDAQSGTIDFAGGNATFLAGTQFTGAGVNRISNNAGFVGAFSSDNLVLAAGSFVGDNSTPAALNGSVTWTGGQFAGTWGVVAGQTLNVQDGADKNFSGTNFTNQGTVAWQSAERAGFISANVVNEGLWDTQADASLSYTGGSGSNFINTGTFRKSAGAGSTLINSANIAFVNSGTVDAQAGTIDFAGGNATFLAGTQFTGAGVNRISNNAGFVGAFSSDNLVLAAGSFVGDNTTPALLNGSVTWTGGQFAGTWGVAAGQTLNVEAGADKNFSGTSFTNQGTVAWQSAERAGFIGSNVANEGLWDMQADANLSYAAGSGSNFINSGTFRKSAGAGSTVIGANIAFSNPGRIEALSGTIQLPANFVNPGTIAGTATVQTSLLTNDGHVAPGAAVGTLTLVGSFVQGAAGFFDVDLNVLGHNDLLVVTGAATLNGTLALNCFGACSLAVGDELRILDASGPLVGSFLGEPVRTGFASGNFEVIYDRPNGDVWLRVTETVTAVPEPGTWALMFAGLALTTAAARRRRG